MWAKFLKCIRSFKMSLSFKLTLYFLILSIAPLVILGAATYINSSEIVKKYLVNEASKLLEQAITNLEYYFKEMEYVSAEILFNRNLINEFCMYKGSDTLYDINRYNSLKRTLTEILSSRENINSIVLASTRGYSIATNYFEVSANEILKNLPLFPNYQKDKCVFTIISNGVSLSNTYLHTYPSIENISLIRELTDIYSQKKIGIIVVNIPYNIIQETMSNALANSDCNLILLDSMNNVIFSKQNEQLIKIKDLLGKLGDYKSLIDGIFEIEINQNKFFALIETSEISGWKVIELIPFKKMMAPVWRLKNLTLLLILCSSIITSFIYILISDHILKPLKELCFVMKKVEGGDLEVSLQLKEKTIEITTLIESFNQMVAKLKETREKLLKEQEAKREAELSALLAQINPHFLYNTLDTIKWLAVLRGEMNIARAITALINLLRSTLRKGREIISIEEELENVKNYVEIQKLRYYNSFEVYYYYDDEILKYAIPKLTLQPLVENSLYHGFEKQEDGKIEIRIEKRDNLIIFEVKDNGRGFNKEILSKKYEKNNKFTGLGLVNIEERIKLYFGEGYGLEIITKEGEGTRVIGKIPALLIKEEGI
jgi:two-component system sensor histidine kinase YesM